MNPASRNINLSKLKESKVENRGEEFEKSLPASDYFNDAYFDLRQLMAQMTQIKMIHDLRPADMIEVGIGNGLTSSFLGRSGLDVVTADINPNLKPDICCPLSELPARTQGRQFDLVVCCEVLEHMPLSELDKNIASLRAMGKRLFLTLPGYSRSFGVSGTYKIPGRSAKEFYLYWFFDKDIDLAGTEHFWEVGSEKETSRSSIISRLKTHYPTVRSGRVSAQPNHIYFIAE